MSRGVRVLSLSDFDDVARCAMTPEDALGPYYVCMDFREAIAEDRPGYPLRLGFRILDGACAPVAGAVVDVWHCDAGGYYSGFDADPDKEAGTTSVQRTDTRFCRGSQLTDDEGVSEFETIFPGWYAGRTTHIHVRVYLPDGRTFVTQTYFEESVRNARYSDDPYDAPRDARYPLNSDEGVRAETTMRTADDGARMTATINLSV